MVDTSLTQFKRCDLVKATGRRWWDGSSLMDNVPNNAVSSRTAVFPGRYKSLNEVVDFVTGAAQAAGLDADGVNAVQLAVDEACSNIIDHAYGGEGHGEIKCTCHIAHDRLTVQLRDYGSPFDPSCVSDPDLECDLEERGEGGLGLYIMRRLMDEIHFECTSESGNTLTMVKRQETSG